MAQVVPGEAGMFYVYVGMTRYDFTDEAAAQQFLETVTPRETAMAEWQRRARAILALSEQIVVDGRALSLLYEDNDLFQVIAATPEGQVVPGSSWSQARAISVGALMQDLELWLQDETIGVPAAPTSLPIRRRVIMTRD